MSFILANLICILLFMSIDEIYLPIYASVLLILFCSVHVFRMYKKKILGPLGATLFLVYLMPFIHFIPYLWFDFESETPIIMWGLMVNPYMIDKTIIKFMGMLGALGAMSILFGYLINCKKISLDSNVHLIKSKVKDDSLSITLFTFWVFIAIIFSWLSAPKDTILNKAYTDSKSYLEGANFSSAWMFSYCFFIFAFSDMMFEKSVLVKKIKSKVIFLGFFIIVIWYQLLRGDRECITMIFALLIIYFVWGNVVQKNLFDKTKVIKGAFVVGLLFVVSHFVGVFRSLLSNVSSIEEVVLIFDNVVASDKIMFDSFFSGTWSAVLLTPLSVSGDYINNELTFLNGRTYFELFCSLMPGFVADWIGYTRPIDGHSGPAWQMKYGIGGTHALVTPFMNFGVVGVALVLSFWGLIFYEIEKFCSKNLSVVSVSLMGIIIMAAPHWLWYGEKSIINALIIWFILAILYKIKNTSFLTSFESKNFSEKIDCKN